MVLTRKSKRSASKSSSKSSPKSSVKPLKVTKSSSKKSSTKKSPKLDKSPSPPLTSSRLTKTVSKKKEKEKEKKKKPVSVKKASRVNSGQIDISSESEEEEISIDLPVKSTGKKTEKTSKKTGKTTTASRKPISTTNATTTIASPSRGGRPKKLSPVPIVTIPLRKKDRQRSSAVQEIRYRSVVTHSAKLIRLAQSVFDQAAAENGGTAPPAVVVEKALYSPRASHRKRIVWSPAEEECLEQGVERHGEGHWAAILQDSSLRFHASRTQVDLKDKWRNMRRYVPYNQISTRKFILVNSHHQPILTASGHPHIYNNKWPRDAAAKAATKDEFYPVDPVTGQRPKSIMIFLRELIDEAVQRESVDAAARASVVHVYRGTRTLEAPPPNVPRFANYEGLWRADVEKLACEQLLTAELLKNTEVVDPEAQARTRGYLD